MSELAQLLADARLAGVYRNAIDLTALEQAALAADIAFARVDLSRHADKEGVLAAIGDALHFPDWYGANFDALADCLSDLDWRRHAGHVLVLEHCHGLLGAAPDEFATLLDIFLAAADDARDEGTPLWCLIDVEAPGIPDLQPGVLNGLPNAPGGPGA